MEKEYLAYDSTSISSYSQCLRQVRYGKNKDHEHLAQLNLCLLFGQQSRLPFYYRKLAGNIPDVKTLRKLLHDMHTLGYEKVKVVLDRGFFSAANINEMYKHHLKFLIAAKLPLKLIEKHLDPVREKMRSFTHYSQAYQLYACSLPITWEYVQDRPYKGDTIEEDRRMYLHLYYSPERALEDEKAFDNLKERLNLRRVAVSSEQSLDGKLFVQFIALIFLSYITKRMQENKLFKDYTLQEILDELDVIECFEVPGQQRQVGEITKRQMDLYAKLGVTTPASLQ